MELEVRENIVVNGVPTDRAVSWIDKQAWGEGPWQTEWDKLQWVDAASGLDCLIVRNDHAGTLCGYVGVAEGHPAFGLHYDAASELAPPDDEGYRGLAVHGGLSFAGVCQEDP